MTTIFDNRSIWEYKGCKIVPIDFGFGMRSRYWRIYFPDQSWIHIATKNECRQYIDNSGMGAK